MTVLVTGGAGYVGAHVALAFHDAGREVVVLDDLSSGCRSAVPAGSTFVQGDIADADLVRSIITRHDVQTVMHLAASVEVEESFRKPLAYYDNNTARSCNFLRACVEAGVRNFVYSSTAAVYAAVAAGLIGEAAPTAPASPYGASKLATERMLQDASAAHGLRHVILRYFNVAGADPLGRAGRRTLNSAHLVRSAVEAVLGRRASLTIHGSDYPTRDGTCVRDYVHVSDVARAHVLAAAHLEAGGENLTLNCGYGRGVSVREVVATVRRMSGVDFKVEEGPRRAGDLAEVVADTREIRKRLDWAPLYDDLDEIVGSALRFEAVRVLA